MIDLGTIHFVDEGLEHCGSPDVAQALFYYCLKLLRLTGLDRLSFAEMNQAIKLEKRKQKNSNAFGNLYSSDIRQGNEIETTFRSKYNYIPLLFIDTARSNIFKGFQELLSNFILKVYSPEYECIYDVESILNAAVGRVLIMHHHRPFYWPPSGYWLSEPSFLKEAGKFPNIRIVKWFVTNGTESSLNDFQGSVNASDSITHVLVKNHGLCT